MEEVAGERRSGRRAAREHRCAGMADVVACRRRRRNLEAAGQAEICGRRALRDAGSGGAAALVVLSQSLVEWHVNLACGE